MANNQKDNKSGDSRLGQDKNRGAQSGKQGSNNPSGESKGQNPGAQHKGNTGNSGNLGKSDTGGSNRGGSRM